jgi:hypothetical protein
MKMNKMPILPLINTERNNHQNFYSMCIRAIKKNNSKILNDINFIKKIEELKNRPYKIKKKKFLPQFSHFSFNKYSSENKSFFSARETRLTNKKITLGEIIKESQILDSKIIINKIPVLNQINQGNNKDEESHESKNRIIKLSKRIPSSKKEEIKSNINKSSKIKPRFSKKNIPRVYYIFKKILEYLESNDITLYEYINHNPFQERPFQISKSFEFINAVKFKNYEYVIEALQFSKAYLFSFDYYGQTCYHWAAKLSNEKMLLLLLEYGKHHNQKDFKGRTPLYLAAVNDDRNICEILVKNKANVYLADDKGFNPVDVAGSKDLKYYLGELLAQPYSNPLCRQRIANFLRKRDDKVEEKKIMEKKIEEAKRKEKAEEEELEEENDEEE